MTGRLGDAILVAREFLLRNQSHLATRMPVHLQLDRERETPKGLLITEAHGINVRSLISQQVAVANKTDSYPVEVISVPANVAQIVRGDDGSLRPPDRILRSILRRYPARAEIRVLGNLNACWNRFVLCKELAHLVMGENDGIRTQDVEQQLQMALTIGRGGRLDQELTGEEFAWFMAAELMFPFFEREAMLNRYPSQGDSIYIARAYWMPKAIVDLYFEPAYFAACRDLEPKIAPLRAVN